MTWLIRKFFSVDPRTLGFFRIALALLLLADLAHRMLAADLWYSNDGLLPNHTGLWRPLRGWVPSIFWTCSATWEALALMSAVGLCYVGLLVGYRTRLFQILAWCSIVSLQVRVDILSNGGDFVLAILCCWTVFLPLGKRYSIDAWLQSGRRVEPVAAAVQTKTEPIVSLAVLATTTQFALIYFFNTIHKTGDSWANGSAVRDLWHQARIATPLAIWARDLPLLASQVLSWGTLVVEGLLVLLILSPLRQAWCRGLAIVLVIALHGSISLSANLGVFSYAMMVFSLLLLQPEHWTWAEQRVWPLMGRRGAARLELLSRWADARRGEITIWLGAPAASVTERTQDARALLKKRNLLLGLREAAVALLMVAAILQTLIENRAIPEALKPQLGPWHTAVISYTRLQQGWQMFAPDTPTTETFLRVDATTLSGAHVDPIALAAGAPNEPQSRLIPTSAMGLSVYFVSYMQRIPRDARHHRPLTEWIQKYHERTGNEQDRVVAFEAFNLQVTSPKPGEQQYTAPKSRRFLHWSQAEAKTKK